MNLAPTTNNISNQIKATVANDLRSMIMDAIIALNKGNTLNEEPPVPQVNSVTTTTDSVIQLTKMVADL